jgi:hypothetical protein
MRAPVLVVTLGCAVLAGAAAPAGSIDLLPAQTRGRGGIQVLSLMTTAWEDGD